MCQRTYSPRKSGFGPRMRFPGLLGLGDRKPRGSPQNPRNGEYRGLRGLGRGVPKRDPGRGHPQREPGPRYHFENGDRCPAQEKTPPIGPAELIVARQHDGHDRFAVIVTRTDDGDDPNTLVATGCHQEKNVKFEVIRSGFAEDGRSKDHEEIVEPAGNTLPLAFQASRRRDVGMEQVIGDDGVEFETGFLRLGGHVD